MDIEDIREYCLSKEASSESMPFDDKTLVFKVYTKMFALVSLEKNLTINLKCQTEDILKLKEEYPAIKEGYHMNKKHWITVTLNETITPQFLSFLIDNSYNLVKANVPKKYLK